MNLAVNRFGLKLAVVGITTVVMLSLSEIAARVVENDSAEGSVDFLTAYDPYLGWSKIPNGSVENITSEFHVVERTNSKGLRGPELCARFIQGRHISDELEVPVDVVNAGTVGYATDQELLFYEAEGYKYNPDITVLLFYVNDVWFNNQTRYWRGQKPSFKLVDGNLKLTNSPVPEPDPEQFAFEVQGGRGLALLVRRIDAWLGSRSFLYRVARRASVDSAFVRRQLIQSGLAEVPGEWMPWRKNSTKELSDAWLLTEALLVRLRDRVQADSSQFAVFYIPSRPGVYPSDWLRTQQAYAMDGEEWDPAQDSRVLESICQQSGIPYIMPLSDFRETAQRLSAPQDPLYFLDDAHWTPRGHRLAGRIIADYVAKRIID